MFDNQNRTVEGLKDLIVLRPKNDALVPWCARELIKIALERGQDDVIMHFAPMLKASPEMMSQINAENVAESYFAARYNSKLVCADGYDIDNGIDVKTVAVGNDKTSAHIGNCKVKEKLAVLIVNHDTQKVIATRHAIPVPGKEDTHTIPLTPNFKVWDQYEFAACFDPEDVEVQEDRRENGKWFDKELLKLTRTNDCRDGRLRISCKGKSFTKAMNGEFDIVYFIDNNEDLPVYLDPEEFKFKFDHPFAASIGLRGKSINADNVHIDLFPRFAVHGAFKKNKSDEFNAKFPMSKEMDPRNLETLRKVKDQLVSGEFEKRENTGWTSKAGIERKH